MRRGEISLSDTIETNKDGSSLSLMDVICSDEDLFEDLSHRETYGKLYEALDKVLGRRERSIIAARYGLDGKKPKTQREVADENGISRSYVSRIEKKALQKLQEYLGKDER